AAMKILMLVLGPPKGFSAGGALVTCNGVLPRIRLLLMGVPPPMAAAIAILLLPMLTSRNSFVVVSASSVFVMLMPAPIIMPPRPAVVALVMSSVLLVILNCCATRVAPPLVKVILPVPRFMIWIIMFVPATLLMKWMPVILDWALAMLEISSVPL